MPDHNKDLNPLRCHMNPSDVPAPTIRSSYGLAAVDPPIPMLILERDFRIRWISRAAIKELRLQPDMLIGRSWYDLFPESRSRRALHEALCRGERDAIDLPCIALSLGCGTQYFSLRLRPLHAADGSVESILGLGEDVTARVHAERALRTSEERFREISTHSQDMVIISSADGTVTFESEAVKRILGPRRASRPVISIYDNMHPEDLPPARAMFEDYRALNIVNEASPSSVSAIAERSVSRLSTMTRVVRRLEKKGFVRLTNRPSDGRVTDVHLTSQGKQAIQSVRAVASQIYNAALDGFSSAEIAVLNSMMHRVFSNLMAQLTQD